MILKTLIEPFEYFLYIFLFIVSFIFYLQSRKLWGDSITIFLCTTLLFAITCVIANKAIDSSVNATKRLSNSLMSIQAGKPGTEAGKKNEKPGKPSTKAAKKSKKSDELSTEAIAAWLILQL